MKPKQSPFAHRSRRVLSLLLALLGGVLQAAGAPVSEATPRLEADSLHSPGGAG